MPKNKRIVITGLGIVSPLGIGIKEYWRRTLAGAKPLTGITIFPAEEFECRKAFQVKDFDFARHYRSLKSEYIPRSTKMLLVSAKAALGDSFLNGKSVYKDREWGVFTSTIYGSRNSTYHFYKNILLNGPDSVDPMAFPPALINYSSSYLCMLNGFRGPNITFSSGIHGGLEAINFAANLIKQGYIKASLINGLNDLSIFNYAHLSRKKLLYSPRFSGGYQAGVFYKDRKGIILGENATTIIMEDFAVAKKRKAKIYAEICGYSINFGKTLEAYEDAMLSAIAKSGLKAKDIDACFISSGGVKSMDLSEIGAIKNIFKDNPGNTSLVCLKENNGECEGASSVLQVLVAAKSIHCARLPFSAGINGIGIASGIKFRNKPGKRNIANVLVNSFNLEGNNASVVIRRV